MKRSLYFLRYIFYSILIVVVLYFVVIIGWGTITDYRPDDISTVEIQGTASKKTLVTASTLAFITWNIGYCGLGAEMDFFMTGAKACGQRPIK